MKKTPLHAFHQRNGAKMSEFAGFALPVSFEAGILAEHKYTREVVSLFDVSNLGCIKISSRNGDMTQTATALERLSPADILDLSVGKQRYILLTNERGGIFDDIIIANHGDHFLIVVNGSRREKVYQRIDEHISDYCQVEMQEDRAMLALQGPKAAELLSRLVPAVNNMRFMEVIGTEIMQHECWLSRSGYTGEDGFEIIAPAAAAEAIAQTLLDMPEVRCAGLGARDSLRVEAGLLLYGADIHEEITPVTAGLQWTIGKERMPDGSRFGGFPGEKVIFSEIANGSKQKITGFVVTGRAPIRAKAKIFTDETGAEKIGVVTSGIFSPCLKRPIGLALIDSKYASVGNRLFAELRNSYMPIEMVALPFVRRS